MLGSIGTLQDLSPIAAAARPFVGTSGDPYSAVLNISVASACGVPVVKHGNRAARSTSGLTDALGALRLRTDLSPDRGGRRLSHGRSHYAAPVPSTQDVHTPMTWDRTHQRRRAHIRLIGITPHPRRAQE